MWTKTPSWLTLYVGMTLRFNFGDVRLRAEERRQKLSRKITELKPLPSDREASDPRAFS